jgi:predicted O-methyltransferase YrrM
VSLEEGIEILTGIEKEVIIKLLKELDGTDFLRHIKLCLRQVEHRGGSLDVDCGLLLYVLTRALKPKIIVETGVANGSSSSFFLKGLEENGMGELYSIDLHYREGISTPPGKDLGWMIPEYLRHRWNLILGESTAVLPKLLNELEGIDIFFHDSRHTYKTMMKESKIVYPYLRRRGLLILDDVTLNDAFLDFANSVKQRPVIFFNRIGAIRKLDGF